MPERPLNREEKVRLQQRWIVLQPDVRVRRRFGPRLEEALYCINGEALSIIFREEPDVDEMGGYGVDHPDEFWLDCSDNHARSMEAVGVLSFTETTQANAHE